MLRTHHYLYQNEGALSYSSQRFDAPLAGVLPPLYPEHLGSTSFKKRFGLRFAYVAGAMARGIASEQLVIEVAKHGGLGFFGSAGLGIKRVSDAIDFIQQELGEGQSFGMNLIHNLKEQNEELNQVRLYLEKGVRNIEAAAFTKVTPAVVWFSFKGIHVNELGEIVKPNTVFAKISHSYVASTFVSPPDEDVLQELIDKGFLTFEEAELAQGLPVAECLTVESDSGGHTDNRPASTLFPVIKELVEEMTITNNYHSKPIVGLAGGIGTPDALSAAFDLGADYCVVGSVHQSCVESGTSAGVKKMLETAGMSDYAMTPSADMFEEGVKVQVYKRGTMMAVNGNRLYEIFKQYNSLEELPTAIYEELEHKVFKKSLDTIWQETHDYFAQHEPSQVEEAQTNPKHKMALLFRWYLGKSNQWPIVGEESRKADYQIWTGPAMGAFNAWVKNSYLKDVTQRNVGQVMLNLLEGATYHKRIQQIKSFGIDIQEERYQPQPIHLEN